jgi:Leucine-rich repeat (LRR) protein
VLEQLVLDSNAIAALPASIGKYTRLTRLSLRANKLTTVPVEIASCTSLAELDLSGNALASLPVKELASLPALTRLNIRSVVAPEARAGDPDKTSIPEPADASKPKKP